MKKTLLFSAILILGLIIAPSYAGMGVGAVGVSYDRVAGNPGFHIMAGTQFAVDTSASSSIWTLYAAKVEGRMLGTKFNYGQVNIDQMAFGLIYYYDFLRPLWDLQTGLHASGAYQMADGKVGLITGGELRKDISGKFGFFLSGDLLLTDKNPFNLFFVSFGIMANFL
jgi:hypothetical protein